MTDFVSADLFNYLCRFSHPLAEYPPQKVNDSGMDDGPSSGVPDTSIQEPGTSGRTVRPEAPVDSMLKDMATIIFSTFLLAGWVAFVITYPKVSHRKPFSLYHYLRHR